MANYLVKGLLVLSLITSSVEMFAQDNDFEQLSKVPKNSTVNFPLDYKISRPRLEYPKWDDDFDLYYNFHTPALRKTQAALSHVNNGVTTIMTPNSIIPHAQLDTATIVDDPMKFMGIWRMIKYRSIRFNDSVYIPAKAYYRLADTLLDDKSNDEVFAVISDNNFKLYARGRTDFKRMISSKYRIENKRFIMLYKLAKASAGVSQIGIDEKGYLIMNYPKVIEYLKDGAYFSYYAVIEQYIFEKVK